MGQEEEFVFFHDSDQKIGPHILLATPKTNNRFCSPLRTNGYFSCRHGRRTVVNYDRWKKAVRHWVKKIDGKHIKEYRAYVINHELGHFLGFKHKKCRKKS